MILIILLGLLGFTQADTYTRYDCSRTVLSTIDCSCINTGLGVKTTYFQPIYLIPTQTMTYSDATSTLQPEYFTGSTTLVSTSYATNTETGSTVSTSKVTACPTCILTKSTWCYEADVAITTTYIQTLIPYQTITTRDSVAATYTTSGKLCSPESSCIVVQTPTPTVTTTIPWTETYTTTYILLASNSVETASVIVETPEPRTTVTLAWTGSETVTSTIFPSDGSGTFTVIVETPFSTTTIPWTGSTDMTYTTETVTTNSDGSVSTNSIVVVDVPEPRTTVTLAWTGSETVTSTIFPSDGSGTFTVIVETPFSTTTIPWTGSTDMTYTTETVTTNSDGSVNTNSIVVVETPESFSSSVFTDPSNSEYSIATSSSKVITLSTLGSPVPSSSKSSVVISSLAVVYPSIIARSSAGPSSVSNLFKSTAQSASVVTYKSFASHSWSNSSTMLFSTPTSSRTIVDSSSSLMLASPSIYYSTNLEGITSTGILISPSESESNLVTNVESSNYLSVSGTLTYLSNSPSSKIKSPISSPCGSSMSSIASNSVVISTSSIAPSFSIQSRSSTVSLLSSPSSTEVSSSSLPLSKSAVLSSPAAPVTSTVLYALVSIPISVSFSNTGTSSLLASPPSSVISDSYIVLSNTIASSGPTIQSGPSSVHVSEIPSRSTIEVSMSSSSYSSYDTHLQTSTDKSATGTNTETLGSDNKSTTFTNSATKTAIKYTVETGETYITDLHNSQVLVTSSTSSIEGSTTIVTTFSQSMSAFATQSITVLGSHAVSLSPVYFMLYCLLSMAAFIL